MEQNQSTSLFSINLDAQNSYMLRNTASWAILLGILSIISAVLLLIFGILTQQSIKRAAVLTDESIKSSGMGVNALANMGLAIYVIMAILYGLSGLFALNAGNKILSGLKTNEIVVLNKGFAGARNFFALWVIIMILFLIFMLLGLIGLIFGISSL